MVSTMFGYNCDKTIFLWSQNFEDEDLNDCDSSPDVFPRKLNHSNFLHNLNRKRMFFEPFTHKADSSSSKREREAKRHLTNARNTPGRGNRKVRWRDNKKTKEIECILQQVRASPSVLSFFNVVYNNQLSFVVPTEVIVSQEGNI